MQKSTKIKQTVNLLSSLLLALLVALPTCIHATDKKIIIAITKIIDHQSLNNSEQGIIDELNAAGYIPGKNVQLVTESANGSVATANQIAQKFVGLKPDVIVAISTISAQTCAKATRNTTIPLVFSSVTDPLAAGLAGKANITGATDTPPVEQALLLIKEMVPGINKLGVIYNSGDNGSVGTVAELHRLRGTLQITEAIATSSNEVASASHSLVGKVEAIYVPLDNTVVGALEILLKVTNNASIPVFSNDPAHLQSVPVITNNTDDVARGTLAAIGFTQYEVGRVAGKKIVQILKGSTVSTIPISSPNHYELHLNLDSAKALKINLSDALIKRANKLVGESR